jgi:hypothetical protein
VQSLDHRPRKRKGFVFETGSLDGDRKVVENVFAFTMTSQFTGVFRIMQKTWYFPVDDGASHFADNGFTYFAEQASEKAATNGYDVVAMKNVSIDGSRVCGWMIKGTVILKNPTAFASAAHVLQAQMG